MLSLISLVGKLRHGGGFLVSGGGRIQPRVVTEPLAGRHRGGCSQLDLGGRHQKSFLRAGAPSVGPEGEASRVWKLSVLPGAECA